VLSRVLERLLRLQREVYWRRVRRISRKWVCKPFETSERWLRQRHPSNGEGTHNALKYAIKESAATFQSAAKDAFEELAGNLLGAAYKSFVSRPHSSAGIPPADSPTIDGYTLSRQPGIPGPREDLRNQMCPAY
jgi:hypothetical protein